MATFVYICDDHKQPLKAYIERSIFDEEVIPNCTKCTKVMVRVFDAPPVTFMGLGWGKDR